jgi:hypothetical protein
MRSDSEVSMMHDASHGDFALKMQRYPEFDPLENDLGFIPELL